MSEEKNLIQPMYTIDLSGWTGSLKERDKLLRNKAEVCDDGSALIYRVDAVKCTQVNIYTCNVGDQVWWKEVTGRVFTGKVRSLSFDNGYFVADVIIALDNNYKGVAGGIMVRDLHLNDLSEDVETKIARDEKDAIDTDQELRETLHEKNYQ